MKINAKETLFYYILAIVFVLLMAVSQFILKKENLITNMSIWFACSFAVIGLALQAFPIINKLIKKFYGQVLISLLAIIAYPISSAISAHVVHNFVMINPDNFSKSILILTAIFLVPVWLVIFCLIGFVITLSYMLIYYILEMPVIDSAAKFFGYNGMPKYAGLNIAGAFIGLMAILFVCAYGENQIEKNNAIFNKFISFVVLGMDFYGNPECKNTEPTDRIAYLNGDNVYIAKIGDKINTVQFLKDKCL